MMDGSTDEGLLQSSFSYNRLISLAGILLLQQGRRAFAAQQSRLVRSALRRAAGNGQIAASILRHELGKGAGKHDALRLYESEILQFVNKVDSGGRFLTILRLAEGGLKANHWDQLVGSTNYKSIFDRANRAGLVRTGSEGASFAHPLLAQQHIFWIPSDQAVEIARECLAQIGRSMPHLAGLLCGLASTGLLKDVPLNVHESRVQKWIADSHTKLPPALASRLLSLHRSLPELAREALAHLPIHEMDRPGAAGLLDLIDSLGDERIEDDLANKLSERLVYALRVLERLGQFQHYLQLPIWQSRIELQRSLLIDYFLTRMNSLDDKPVRVLLNKLNMSLSGSGFKHPLTPLVKAFLGMSFPDDQVRWQKKLVSIMLDEDSLTRFQQLMLNNIRSRALATHEDPAKAQLLAESQLQAGSPGGFCHAHAAFILAPDEDNLRKLRKAFFLLAQNDLLHLHLTEVFGLLSALIERQESDRFEEVIAICQNHLLSRPLDMPLACFRIQVGFILMSRGTWDEALIWIGELSIEHKAMRTLVTEFLLAQFLVSDFRQASYSSPYIPNKSFQFSLAHQLERGGQSDDRLHLIDAVIRARLHNELPGLKQLKKWFGWLMCQPLYLRSLFLPYCHELLIQLARIRSDSRFQVLHREVERALEERTTAGSIQRILFDLVGVEDRFLIRARVLEAVSIALSRNLPSWILQLHRFFPRLRLDGLSKDQSRDRLDIHLRIKWTEALISAVDRHYPFEHLGFDFRPASIRRALQHQQLRLRSIHHSALSPATMEKIGELLTQIQAKIGSEPDWPTIRLSIIGKVHVQFGALAIPASRIGKGILRELLCFMLVEHWRHPGRSWTAQELVQRTWNHGDARGFSRNSFYVHISNLKKLFREFGVSNAIERVGAGYTLRRDLHVDVDLGFLQDATRLMSNTKIDQVELDKQIPKILSWLSNNSAELDTSLKGIWLDDLRAWHEQTMMRMVVFIKNSLSSEASLGELEAVERKFFGI
jgi:hypothetical protein